jgi:hypothetical protein
MLTVVIRVRLFKEMTQKELFLIFMKIKIKRKDGEHIILINTMEEEELVSQSLIQEDDWFHMDILLSY